MTPISALAILFCIYAVSELIAQKTKAIFSTVLSIAILLLQASGAASCRAH